MQIIFRVDASHKIGTGHVMRCLTLASFLQKKGADVLFLSRAHSGHLIDYVQELGIKSLVLPTIENEQGKLAKDDYETWLGATWQEDIRACQKVLAGQGVKTDWLVVDHYAIDARWHREMRDSAKKIMVIDDLANREMECDLLLDQNYAHPAHAKYPSLTPDHTKLLLGPDFALIREEFNQLRASALERRGGEIRRLLVSLGGADIGNDTQKILNAFRVPEFADLRLDVVIGSSNPHQKSLENFCSEHQNMDLHIQTPHMAQLMKEADCAFTAGGSTTWERCVMGLPAFVTIQAENQKDIAIKLAEAGVHFLLGPSHSLTPTDYAESLEKVTSSELMEMSKKSASICDGLGVRRVAEHLREHV